MADPAPVILFNRLSDHALASGRFDQVNRSQPKSKPGGQLVANVWLDRVDGVPAGSGLDITTALLTFMIDLFIPANRPPVEDIDADILSATWYLMGEYNADFELGGDAMAIDLLGLAGVRLSARLGNVTWDQTTYRISTITVPVLVDDAWPQAQ